LGSAFVIYQGSHGDVGAHRADIILPGAAYTEKDGLYVNFEGRVQRARRATFPPGEAREDWAILRALSEVIGKRLPYDSLEALRSAIVAQAPHFGRHGEAIAHAGAGATNWQAIGAAGPLDVTERLRCSMADFYLTNPIARASATMAQCSREFVTGAPKMAAE
jgi:NADH-quinone oxidoreductase subunit G